MRELWGDRAHIAPAKSLHEAARLLTLELDLILCTIHFDESRMFELLRLAKALQPGTPFVCCRVR